MKSQLALLAAIALGANSVTAQPARSYGDEPIHPGRRTAIYIGMPFGEFTAQTSDGKIISNRNFTGRISLVLFWYPSLAYSNRKYSADYLQFAKLPALTREHADFQIISLLADTTALTLFRQQNPEASTFLIAKLTDRDKAFELNAGNGMPSCILVDREGRIARINHLGRLLDEQALVDKIRELTMQ